MNAVDIQAALGSVGELKIAKQTTSDDVRAAMKMLGNFNQCIMGLVYFLGSTPWERHPDDELLQILEGEVDVTILSDSGVDEVTLYTGSIFIVPRGLWHKQHSYKGVKLLFITSQEGNEASEAEDPRTNSSVEIAK
ncbi:cupin domain-containing protein [Halotia wernerae UHCC 0503]|nr:cupin domain-containing protein [Halotia wernerae UHCC 0503]